MASSVSSPKEAISQDFVELVEEPELHRSAYPPYPPYSTVPAPPSVADTIVKGRNLRVQHKSMPKQAVRPPPRPAKPRGPKVSNVKLSRRALRAHARCLRRHGAVLTDRLEHMAKPPKRSIIGLWREHANKLSPETIARLRCMLDADEPFKPDQAYEYFINMRKTKRKNAAATRVNKIKKDVHAMCGDKRFVWARDATIAFARGIQQRLARPAYYNLNDGMLRLSNIILGEVCSYLHMRPPSRRCTHPKAKFMTDVADKVAVWIDEILSDSEEKMLMMDFDEDEDVERFLEDDQRPIESPQPMTSAEVTPSPTPKEPSSAVGTPNTTPGGTPGTGATPASGATPATSNASISQSQVDILEYSNQMLGRMPSKRKEILKADRSDDQGFDDDFLNMMGGTGGGGVGKDGDRSRRAHEMFAGEHKDAFNILTNSMDKKGGQTLLSHGPITQTYEGGSDALKQARSFDAPGHNQAMAGQLRGDLAKTAKSDTPAKLEGPMKYVIDIASKYLAHKAEKDAKDKGNKVDGRSSKYLAQPVEHGSSIAKNVGAAYNKLNGDQMDAFKILTKSMDKKGDEHLVSHGPNTLTYKGGAKELKEAESFDAPKHSLSLAKKIEGDLKDTVNTETPAKLVNAMKENVRAAYKKLNGDKLDAFNILTTSMEKKGEEELLTHGPVTQTFKEGASDLKTADSFHAPDHHPALSSQLNKDLAATVKADTPANLQSVMEDVVDLSSKYLSQKAEQTASGVRGKGSEVGEGAPANEKFTEVEDISSKYLTHHVDEGNKEITASGGGAGAKSGLGTSEAVADGLRAETYGERPTGGDGGGSTDASKYTDAIGLSPKSSDEDALRRKRKEIERLQREADAANMSKEEAERRRLEEENRRSADAALERASATGILHKQLRDRGGETFYKQPQTEMTHAQASEWLKKSPIKVDSTVKNSGDTDRLHKKFERKLNNLVTKVTPPHMTDVMQDVVIESSRILSEVFVAQNYKTLAREALISEMQKRGNELLIELDGAAESYFFSAQRLKKTKTLEVQEPCSQVAYYIRRKLEDMIRCRAIARKVSGTMKEHIKEVSEYLSDRVTKPDEQIEAYVSLLDEMEAAGDSLLIEGNIPKSYKESAAFLRQLTSNEDQIRRANSSLHSATKGRLKNLMSKVASTGYSASVMDSVIDDASRLLVSYIMLQGEKTEALKVVIHRMVEAGDAVILRHGNVRKTFADGADLLEGKNTDQIRVSNADPVAARKIQIKLDKLMKDNAPSKFSDLIDEVIEDTTMYLAVYFFKPRLVKVCKCMKNVFVQCELWCDEILRRVARPCCRCGRHLSVQTIGDPSPERREESPGSSRAYATRTNISVTPCPSRQDKIRCPASNPTCDAYYVYTDHRNHKLQLETRSQYSNLKSVSGTPASFSPVKTFLFDNRQSEHLLIERRKTISTSMDTDNSAWSLLTPVSSSAVTNNTNPGTAFGQPPTTLMAQVYRDDEIDVIPTPEVSVPGVSSCSRTFSNTSKEKPVSTENMTDWHAMMVSLMWNVQAWRAWIQEIFDKANAPVANVDPALAMEQWTDFVRGVSTEALQWRHYNTFSRNLTLRLALRYRDKQIVSPTRGTPKTQEYTACQQEMLDIIHRFNKWTQWLSVVVKEADTLRARPGSNITLHELRWNHVREKVQEYSEDWLQYNVHLRVCWEDRYSSLVAEWLPAWNQPGPVWVVSACGAVPSGAVAAGVYEGEVVWMARTTHNTRAMPAALRPSKHCCVLYSEGAVHYYTKYQVLCNADVSWTACRSGAPPPQALPIASETFTGRVLYHGSHLIGPVLPPNYKCHVVIFGRPFAFNCFEVLTRNVDE